MLSRRQFIAGLALAAPCTAMAQAFPTRPIRLVVGFSPGGGLDLTARPIAQRMSSLLGQTVVVENRAGANGNIAADYVSKQAADGYVLLHANMGQMAIGPHLYRGLTFDYLRDFVPVAGVTRGGSHVMVHHSLPVRTLPEFIAHACANPGTLNFASGGIGTQAHLMFELLRMRENLDITHIPYRGTGPAVSDMITGRVHLMIDGLNQVRPAVDAGQVRLLAVTGTERMPTTPDLPTAREQGIPYLSGDGWQMMAAPAGTPKPVLDRLEEAVRAALADANLAATMLAGGTATRFTGSGEMLAILQEDHRVWGAVIRDAKVTLE